KFNSLHFATYSSSSLSVKPLSNFIAISFSFRSGPDGAHQTKLISSRLSPPVPRRHIASRRRFELPVHHRERPPRLKNQALPAPACPRLAFAPDSGAFSADFQAAVERTSSPHPPVHVSRHTVKQCRFRRKSSWR